MLVTAGHVLTMMLRNQHQQKVVAKSVDHFRLQNEQDVLLRFQNQSRFIRPLIDEADTIPPTIMLRYLDDDILCASNNRRLTSPEVKYVAKGVLEALSILHNEGFVHTGKIYVSELFSLN
jgi:serine/threonine protein kinase